MAHNRQITSKLGLDAENQIREICKALPEVVEQVDGFGHTSFRVKDKPFVMLGENEGVVSISVKTLPTTQEFLLQQPGYSKTPHIGQHGWTSFQAKQDLNWEEIRGYIFEGYLRAAPKSLAKLVSNAEC
ncbi:MmcQ/YjbR family DNA-binding protein [Neobacillus sp. 114]|uniref:MmcQ/YjbR family DNA-binding protein n=1 Tax=Neobacillus sp. 114 TaxID=3048535 RepID=UPI0024C2398C|nr:MmcQ/YjbR family DNA-binding protein [Neobacillus sp. 114]